MPAIRDWTFNYTTSTSGTSISCAMPQYAPGDLLVAILSADTGLQTWTPPAGDGWTVLFSRSYNNASNTVNLAVAYKICGSSESNPKTFTYSTAETANMMLITIRDVDTSTPIANWEWADLNAARGAMPTDTATRDNSLILYAWAHPSTAVIPSVIEGPVTQIIAKDGSAHSDGAAWAFQRTAGTSPNNIYITVAGTTYSMVTAVVIINPPSTGATVIPAYCAADNSVYVDPIHGTTAFQGNTAFAGTATTYWTSPLAGRTLANATVTAKTDYGINTYRSCGGMTGPTTENTYQGATLVLADANRINATGKNILIHAMPLVPADIQTVYDAGLGKGIEVGLASSLDNAITWHVHGAMTPWGIKRTPVVINPSNTSGRIDTRGTLDTTLIKIFGFFTCGFLVSSDWTWTMIWLSDTTVVAGGNSTEPVDLLGIVKVVADGHERMSALLQGKNEGLILQPIQVGDGGTHPVYLKLDATTIEFPEIYNLSARQTYYCSIDNYSGITYYAGANDTIIHRNSVISSSSKYHWRIHSNSSTSATYDFSNLTLIGAGDIDLKAGITFDSMTFNRCDEVDAVGATITNCTFINTNGSGALSIDSPSEMALVTDCSFTNNSTYGIRLLSMTAQTYDFDNIKFSGNNKDVYIAATSGTVTINVLNGGDTPTYYSEGATVVINNAVTLKIIVKDRQNNVISNAQCAIYRASDDLELMNKDSDTNGVAETTFNFPGSNVDVYWRVRKSSEGAMRYTPAGGTGTITSSGFTVTVTLYEEPLA